MVFSKKVNTAMPNITRMGVENTFNMMLILFGKVMQIHQTAKLKSPSNELHSYTVVTSFHSTIPIHIFSSFQFIPLIRDTLSCVYVALDIKY